MAETKNVYLILDIEEYGKFISYCIEHDISVWRTYWDEREKGNRCYQIDWGKKDASIVPENIMKPVMVLML